MEMFKAGYFSSEPLDPCQVDSTGLKRLTMQQLARGLQVTETNPINGLEGRAGLLLRLGDALKNTALFGKEGRPGHMLGKPRLDHAKLAFKVLKTFHRLSPLSSYDASCLRPHNHNPHPLDRSHQWPWSRLALHTHKHRWCLSRRCLALLFHACIAT